MASVVFLRGVNVGGHKTFRPKVLAARLRHLDAVNIGAAGTFVIRKPVKVTQLRGEFERRLPFAAEIMICPGRDIAALVSRDEFKGHPVRSDIVRFVSVLARSPRLQPAVPLQFPASGPWLVKVLARHGRYLVGVYRRQMKAIGHLGKLDRAFGVPATTRNWNTLLSIARVLAADS